MDVLSLRFICPKPRMAHSRRIGNACIYLHYLCLFIAFSAVRSGSILAVSFTADAFCR